MSVLSSDEKMRRFYMLEKHRIESFKDWPYSDSDPCSIAKMAEAGFYWSGNKREKDTASCFVCSKTLDGWEANDDPWKEHLKHAPQCEFVKLGCAEKDITVEQFVKIVCTVIKSKIRSDVNNFKLRFEKDCRKQLDNSIKKH